MWPSHPSGRMDVQSRSSCSRHFAEMASTSNEFKIIDKLSFVPKMTPNVRLFSHFYYLLPGSVRWPSHQSPNSALRTDDPFKLPTLFFVSMTNLISSKFGSTSRVSHVDKGLIPVTKLSIISRCLRSLSGCWELETSILSRLRRSVTGCLHSTTIALSSCDILQTFLLPSTHP